MPNSKLGKFLIDHNRAAVKEYADPDAELWRRQYRARHPTEIAALKCMDGRLHLPVMSNVPIGIIQPFRNIGGQFDLGWPFFGLLVQQWVNTAVDRGHDAIILITYHFSKGDPHRGCAGWNYNTEAAIKDVYSIKAQMERVFGENHSVVYPIVIGIETDEDAFILHGANGESLDLSKETASNKDTLRHKIRILFPDMKSVMIDDLLPIVMGNLTHIAEVRAEERTPIEASHMEQIMGIGRGFDWLHLHNKALLIGPFSYDLSEPITKAAGILLSNIKDGRIPNDEGIIVMTSATYLDDMGTEKLIAVEKAYSLVHLAKKTIMERVPDLIPHIHYLVGTVNLNTREYEPLPFDEE